MMTKSKEEILDSVLGESTRSMMSDSDIYAAMDEWGKQCVFLFGQFMLKNDMAYDAYRNPKWGLMSHSQKEAMFFNEFLPSLFEPKQP